MNKNIKIKKSAFSLLEVIMILFIASVGIMAALSLAIRSAYFQQAKKELGSAMFLANEGLEIMRNIRDTNVITSSSYDNWTGTGSAGNGVHLYKVDYATLLATTTASIDTAVLQQSTSTGFYLHNASFPNSIFNRLITASTTGEVTEVESWVRWKSRGNVFNYKINTILYDPSFKKKEKSAFTLIEVLVSVAIFIVLILVVSRIYINILRSQQSVSGESYVQSDLEYFMQVATNNLRLAEIGDGTTCSSTLDKFFSVGTSSISYIKDGKCFGFYLEDDAIKTNWHTNYADQALTSDKTKVLALTFEVEDNISTGQPIITILTKAEPVDEPGNINYLQTSISLDY